MPITLKAARVNAGYTQREAAAALDISKSTVASYEKGKTIPTADMAQKIAELYKMSSEDIKFF